MADNTARAPDDGYEVTVTSVKELSAEDVDACVKLIAEGGAVTRDYAKAGLPNAAGLAVARREGRIVGVGVIKGPNPQHARTVARRSEVDFPEDTPELGYVSVDPKHRDHRLSSRIADKPLTEHLGPLYATTSSERMETLLKNRGFSKQKQSYDGQRGDKIFVWLRD